MNGLRQNLTSDICHRVLEPVLDVTELPSEVDWVKQGYVTEIKDQVFVMYVSHNVWNVSSDRCAQRRFRSACVFEQYNTDAQSYLICVIAGRTCPNVRFVRWQFLLFFSKNKCPDQSVQSGLAMNAKFLHADKEDSDQIALTRRRIWVFVGRTCPKIRFLTLRLQCSSFGPNFRWH